MDWIELDTYVLQKCYSTYEHKFKHEPYPHLCCVVNNFSTTEYFTWLLNIATEG